MGITRSIKFCMVVDIEVMDKLGGNSKRVVAPRSNFFEVLLFSLSGFRHGSHPKTNLVMKPYGLNDRELDRKFRSKNFGRQFCSKNFGRIFLIQEFL